MSKKGDIIMDEYKEDLRVIRTRKLLSTALFELLETTPFEKITVMDICEKAMVHRATFYNHFEDKEHLLEFTIDEIKEHLFNSAIEKEKFETPKEMYMSLVSKVLDFVEANKEKMLLMLSNNNREKVLGLLLTTLKRSLSYLISKNQYNCDFALPVNVIVDFVSGGITNLGISWLLAKQPYKKQDLLNYFDILLSEKVYLK